MRSLLAFCALHTDNPIIEQGSNWVVLSSWVTLPNNGGTVQDLSPRLHTVAEARRWLGY